MMTVKEVSRLTGISIRTLQYYDKLGLLPAMRTGSGYRLYDDAALERLQQILLFRELEFPLRDIRTILDNPNFDRRKALSQQIDSHAEKAALGRFDTAGADFASRRRTHYAIQRI